MNRAQVINGLDRQCAVGRGHGDRARRAGSDVRLHRRDRQGLRRRQPQRPPGRGRAGPRRRARRDGARPDVDHGRATVASTSPARSRRARAAAATSCSSSTTARCRAATDVDQAAAVQRATRGKALQVQLRRVDPSRGRPGHRRRGVRARHARRCGRSGGRDSSCCSTSCRRRRRCCACRTSPTSRSRSSSSAACRHCKRADHRGVGGAELQLRAHDRARGLLATRRAARAAGRPRASEQGVAMIKRISLLLMSCGVVVLSAAQSPSRSSRHRSASRPSGTCRATSRSDNGSHDPARVRARGGRPARDAAGRRRGTRDRQADGTSSPPIRFESGVADIPRGHVEKLAQVLDSVRDRRNVRLHLVGHADRSRCRERWRASTATTRDCRASAPARWRSSSSSRSACRRRRSPSSGRATRGRSRPTRPRGPGAESPRRGRGLVRRADEKLRDQEVLVTEDFKRVKVCRMETVCKLRYQEGHARRARVKNLVAPLHYEERHDRPDRGVQAAGRAGARQPARQAATCASSSSATPTTRRSRAATKRIYGDHVALSKARAHRVALAMQEALDLPSAAIESDGRGAIAPIASNDTAAGARAEPPRRGRVLVRRPAAGAAGRAAAVPGRRRRRDGDEGLRSAVGRASSRCSSRPGAPWSRRATRSTCAARWPISTAASNVRLRFIGYTRNERLDRRTALVYGDDIGLSAARARRAMETIAAQMDLAPAQAEHEGRGYVQSDDVVNAGFIAGRDVVRRGAGRLRRARTARRLRGRRHHAASPAS